MNTQVKRNIAVSIILSIVTCGIYNIYWFICLTNETNLASGRNQDTSGGLAFLFNLLTCGIYGIYWSYKMGEKISEARVQRGLSADNNFPIIYLLLSIFGLSIVTHALIQNELNNLPA